MAQITTESNNLAACAALSDDELVEQLKQLAACERRASVALIRSLIEFDARRLYLREGCSSLFIYCTQVLHLSEGSAYNRIETARAAGRYPPVLQALERGDVTLTAVRLLAPHLTPANHGKVLASARDRSKHGIQELIASLNPRPAATTMIRRVALQPSTDKPSRTSGFEQDVKTPTEVIAPDTSVASSAQQAVAPTPVPQCRAAVVTPLASERYTLQVTLTRETHEKLPRPGACPAFAAGWRCQLYPRSRLDAADRPSRAAQVWRGSVTAVEPWRKYAIWALHTSGCQACRVAAR